MRIEKIRIVNLNSLYGVHEIDFTAKEYQENNLFLLWGDMGTGKTTVLDAITLALYGCTSRLGKVTTSNEIMSKGTRHCLAEVTFNLNGVRYRSRWSQEFNRNNNPKSQEREICRLGVDGNDEIIETRLQKIDDVIKDLIKLDYDEFTKAVVLEQGKFAEFLNAKPNERAIILEQLTNTSIYSKLGAKVYEIEKDKKQTLDVLMKQQKGVKLMEPEDLAKTHERKSYVDSEIQKLTNDIAELDKAVKWVNDVNQAQNRVLDIKKEEQLYRQKCVEFEPSKQILEIAKRAAGIRHLYDNYTRSEKSLNFEKEYLDVLMDSLPQDEAKVEEIHEKVMSCESDLSKSRQELASNEPVFKQVRELQTTLTTKMGELKQAGDKRKLLEDNCRKETNIWNEAKNTVLYYQKKLEDGDQFFKDHAADETLISDLGTIKTHYQQMRQKFDETKNTLQSLNKSESELDKLRKSYELAHADLGKDEEAYLKVVQDVKIANESYEKACDKHLPEDLECQRDLLIENRAQRIKIANYKEERGKLHDGEACPLCGSVDHPYCAGMTPLVSEVDEKIQRLNAQLNAIRKAKSQLEQAQDLERREQIRIEKCRAALQTLQNQVVSLENVVGEKKETYENQLIARRNQLDAFNQLCEKYGESVEEDSQAEVVCQKLEHRLNQWNLGIKARNEYREKLDNAQKEVEKRQVSCEGLKQQLDELSAEIQLRNDEVTGVQAEIKSIFGDRQVDLEEKKLRDAVTEAELNLKRYLEQHNQVKTSLEKLRTSIVEHRKSLDAYQQAFHSDEALFHEGLKSRSFGDVNEFLSACLDESDLKMLVEASALLEKQGLDIQARLKESGEVLDNLQNQALTSRSYEDLTEEKRQKSSLQKEYMIETGVISQQLVEQNEKSAQREALQSDIGKAESEYDRWHALNVLIGSSKGDEFRKFAQGITFNILLNHANEYLQEKKLMPRYELVRRHVGDQSLEFLVQDYQTGKMRPASNLSGGEKFCLCLALALGLSEMASRNVAIDSLFIDEGLGTLDDQTLDTALNMLKNLSDTKNGRLVGLITHVSRAKELIDTCIVAEKLGGGYSRLNGPGCSSKSVASVKSKEKAKSSGGRSGKKSVSR